MQHSLILNIVTFFPPQAGAQSKLCTLPPSTPVSHGKSQIRLADAEEQRSLLFGCSYSIWFAQFHVISMIALGIPPLIGEVHTSPLISPGLGAAGSAAHRTSFSQMAVHGAVNNPHHVCLPLGRTEILMATQQAQISLCVLAAG